MGWHIAGILGGFIWCTGAVANFVASQAHVSIGPAVSYSIGQGATMISACWGVFVWHEFAGAPRSAKLLLGMRGAPPADLTTAAEVVLAIGGLMQSVPEISEIDINPLTVHAKGEGATALDALIVVG